MWGKIFKKLAESKNYCKIRDHCHYAGKYGSAAHSICNLKCDVSNEIPVVFHNVSNYDYHFILKELSNEFEGKFDCLGKNTFSVQIEKKLQKLTKIEMKVL